MDIKSIAEWACIVAFAIPSFIFGFQKVVRRPDKIETFHRWGYSTTFMVALGVLEIVAAAGLFFPLSRMAAICTWSVILLGALGTHLRAGERKEAIAPIAVGALLFAVFLLR